MICNRSKSRPFLTQMIKRLFKHITKSLNQIFSYEWIDQPPNLIRCDIDRKSGNFYRLTIFQYPANTRENRSR